ncbi:unnamed protein product [Amoebophrya sp. A25]|nr:unnamed protein product [Amoebophrya sp. A25]|eukprot:GSA25T00025569001.1
MEIHQLCYWLRRLARAAECYGEAEEAVMALTYAGPPSLEGPYSEALSTGLYVAPRFAKLKVEMEEADQRRRSTTEGGAKEKAQ